jgi:N-acetylglucosaminyldiphosphoundecaprenol N-acetyl-beta-D-mannosaminyltransferase
MKPPALLFGVPIDDVTMDDTIHTVGELVRSGRQQGRTHQIATVNVDFLVNALAVPEVRRVLQRADLCLADGMPIIWAARKFGIELPERVTGADLVPALAAKSPETGWKIHLFGSADGVAERARDLLLQRHPGGHITADSGPMIKDPTVVDQAVVDSIAAVDPDILCVAFGNPKQERWIEANRHALRTPVMIGIGGTLDLLVGDKRRAPQWMQRSGTEWIFRALQEPGRLGRRYAHDARVFLPKIVSYLRGLAPYRAGATLQMATDAREIRVTVAAPTAGVGGERDPTRIDEALQAKRSVSIQLGDAEMLQPEAMALLVEITRAARRQGSSIHAEPYSRALETQIRDMGLAELLLDIAPGDLRSDG